MFIRAVFCLLKNIEILLNNTSAIWSSAGRVFVSGNKFLAGSYLIFKKQIFMSQLICLLIPSIE